MPLLLPQLQQVWGLEPLNPMQVPQESRDVLENYRRATRRVRSDQRDKLALARTFVPPGRRAPRPHISGGRASRLLAF